MKRDTLMGITTLIGLIVGLAMHKILLGVAVGMAVGAVIWQFRKS